MAWWPTSDRRYSKWRPEVSLSAEADNATDVCYAECMSCGASLYTVVEFESLRPTRLGAIGVEEEWPPASPK